MPTGIGNKPKTVYVISAPHVHRCTSYVADLKKNWAYVNTNKNPKLKYVR